MNNKTKIFFKDTKPVRTAAITDLVCSGFYIQKKKKPDPSSP